MRRCRSLIRSLFCLGFLLLLLPYIHHRAQDLCRTSFFQPKKHGRVSRWEALAHGPARRRGRFRTSQGGKGAIKSTRRPQNTEQTAPAPPPSPTPAAVTAPKVSLETERSQDSAPAPAGSLLDQWTQERSAELAVYVDRLANAFGAARNDTIFGFSAFFRDVDLFLKRTPNSINK